MSYKYVSPKFLNDGCVLSLIASKANKGSVPTSATVVWSDQSRVRNKYTYKNGVPNPTFASKTNWSNVGSGFTYTESGGEVTVTDLGSNAASYKLYVTSASLQVVSGRKYYVRVQMKASQATTYRIACAANSGTGQSSQHTGGGAYELLSCLTTAGGTGNSDFRFISTAATGDITATPIYIKEPQIVDLTELGLAHLSVAQCDELFAFTATEATATLANDVTMNNLGGTVGTRFDKVAVVNGNGDSVSYTNIQDRNNMDTTTGFLAVGSPISTLAVSNNVMTVTSNSTSGGVRLPNLTVGLLNNNRYYFALNVKVTGITISALLFDGLTSTIKSHTGGGAYEKLSGIKLAGQDYNSNPFRVLDNRASGTVDIKQALLVNLTANTYVQALEAKLGRVLTVDECDRLFAFTTSTGTVVVDTQYALTLDGTDDYGAIANTPSLDITTNEFALACTFRVANGASNGYLISKASSNFAGVQYGLYYDTSGTIVIVANGTNIGTVSSTISTNVWYNLIVYRNSAGAITVLLNKATQTPPADYTTALVPKNNARLSGLSTNDAGTAHGAYLKGSIATQHIYQAPTLDIDKIIARETAIAKDYTGVA